MISEGIGSLLTDTWPPDPLWICAVRQSDGRRVVFGRGERRRRSRMRSRHPAPSRGSSLRSSSTAKRISTVASTRRPTQMCCAMRGSISSSSARRCHVVAVALACHRISPCASGRVRSWMPKRAGSDGGGRGGRVPARRDRARVDGAQRHGSDAAGHIASAAYDATCHRLEGADLGERYERPRRRARQPAVRASVGHAAEEREDISRGALARGRGTAR